MTDNSRAMKHQYRDLENEPEELGNHVLYRTAFGTFQGSLRQ